MRRSWLFLGALVSCVLLAMALPAVAFHDGGVAHCDGCHTMHNSADNPADTPAGNQFLLKQSNATDMCLSCHATRLGNSWGGSLAAPGSQSPGGQFIFLTEDNLNDGHAGGDPANFIPGYQAGHSVISVDKVTIADGVNALAPGFVGVPYFASNMHCTSCHDPHGQGNHFRLLYGSPYDSNAMGAPFAYNVPAPTATAGGWTETSTDHSAYEAGMSEWCGNCHGEYHNDDFSVLKHPSGMGMGSTVSANYNAYMGSGDYSGDGTAAYLVDVPFEEVGMTTDYVAAASTTSKVMCLSCHRAHATSAPNAGRWDFSVSFLDEDGLESLSYAIPNPYEATVGADQRSLCNKCHAKDPEI